MYSLLIIICVIATCPKAGLKKVKTFLDGYKILVNKNEVTKQNPCLTMSKNIPEVIMYNNYVIIMTPLWRSKSQIIISMPYIRFTHTAEQSQSTGVIKKGKNNNTQCSASTKDVLYSMESPMPGSAALMNIMRMC